MRRPRLWPDGLAARFALLLVAALLVANAVALGLLAQERARLDRAALIEREIERIVSLVPAIEAAAPERRQEIARSAATRLSRLSVAPLPLVVEPVAAPRSAALTRSLSEALAPRAVRAAIRLRSDRAAPDGTGARGRVTVSVSIRLQGPAGAAPQWLNAVARGAPPAPGPDGETVLLLLGLSLVAVLGVGLAFTRRLTRPLGDLAATARAAGRGDRTARLREEGPRELREAASAFNDMQARIARFDAERMRTLAAVGHDLRTPITSLRIRAEMLDAGEGAPMIRTLDEMAVMAEGLVAFARGAGEGEGEAVVPVDLAVLLERLCAERGAALRHADPATVSGRPVALARALGNLIDNAIRHGGSARVDLRRSDGMAVVTVEDSGPGIPPERLAAVFDPFVRGEDSRSAETGGAGLGLSIARGVAVAHGVDIALENRRTGGLRARMRLPLARTHRGGEA